MIRKSVCLLLLAGLFTACGSMAPSNYTEISKSMMRADEQMKKVGLGMTKEQVIEVMGPYYEALESREGEFVMGYKTYDDGIYKLHFKNDKLTRWQKEWLSRPCHQSSYHSRNDESNNNSDSGTRAHLKAHRNAMLSTGSSDAQKAAMGAHMDAHEKAVLGD